MNARLAFTALLLSGCSSGGLHAVSSATAPALESSMRGEEHHGLGTVWGETRSSPIREVPFERASEQPFAQVAVYYDDRAGVAAMTARDHAPDYRSTISLAPGLIATIIDGQNQQLETFSFGGRLYVVGEAGQRYSLHVRNQTGRRYEVVASVDGLDVVDGQTASVDKRGYVMEPYGSVTIDGFRRSQAEVAAFRFGAIEDSYASRTGDARNVGVIGLAFFDEQGPPERPADDIDRRRGAQPFSDARFAPPPPNPYY
jgi:hypothetical protein